ncbi:ATP-dependent DNA helicase RecG [Candidatus Pelagibacter sp.]|nr:ATP-dependent DNA helicase RecG [Candidatus Pelagibacter sp.]
MNDHDYLLSNVQNIKGIGKKTSQLFKRKNINTIFDLLWHLPTSKIENSKVTNAGDIQIGKLQTIKLIPLKYNFPRIRRLPNRVVCQSNDIKIDCVFFNSYEGYIKKILPLNTEIIISGKINFFRNKYQITNPTQVKETNENILETQNKYSLTDGLTINKYNNIINEVLKELPDLDEWLNDDIKKKFNNIKWKDAILKIHSLDTKEILKSKYYKRLVFDELFAHFLLSSKIRKKIKKIKKSQKNFQDCKEKLIKDLNFKLTNDQEAAIKIINEDLKSKSRMFRLLQGDVGSGKTIVSMIAAVNCINAGYQTSFMVPTEILAKQHFSFAKKYLPKNIKVEMLTGKSKYTERKKTLENLKLGKIDFLIGTHALFQKKVEYNKLGLVIIDEQHKFGVRQRKELSEKGGNNCDVLVMSATPIPRTMMMTVYGDMDLTLIKEKPKNRKKIVTYSKLENKISEIIRFVKKEISNQNQIFWVCPLIEESKKVEQQSVVNKFKYLEKYFKNRIGLIHGSLDKDERNKILNSFLDRKLDILVSTTVIEVGIDFPNANVIVIENADKYGLSQLHQLRGRVGRGNKESYCILMFKSSMSENAKKRIKILKSSDDGFVISEEDMKLRGYGDLLGFKQSGIKNFRLADPILNEDLFLLAEAEVKKLEMKGDNFSKYNKLLKLYDRASIINEVS